MLTFDLLTPFSFCLTGMRSARVKPDALHCDQLQTQTCAPESAIALTCFEMSVGHFILNS